MERIPIAGPWITEHEIGYVTDAVTRCWYDRANEYVDRFERAFANYLGVPFAVALPSCTSAIHLSLLALGIGPGHEVIVPDATWIATSAPVSYVGAAPVFADIDEHSWCLSVESVEGLMNARTRAVIAVDLYGNVPDWSGLRSLCDRHQVPLIEDSAEAIGTKLNGSLAGSLGDIAVFSFHGTKTLTTGEGGMLVTHRRDVYERVISLRDHGRHTGDPVFFNREIGHKYKMSSVLAALGLAQLERVDELVARKRAIMNRYRERLGRDPRLSLNAELAGVENSYWMSTAVVRPAVGLKKESIVAKLSARGIDSRPFFYPLSSLPAYESVENARTARHRNEVAYRLTPFGVNLPSALSLTEPQIDYVSTALLDILDEAEHHKSREAA